MKIKISYENNFADAKIIRKEVFVQEQGFTNEFDTLDKTAVHVTMYANGILIGCARVYKNEEEKVLHIGRIALRKAYRGLGLGRILVESCEAYGIKQGDRKFVLDAQCRMQGFYEALGYHIEGVVHMDEHVPHIQMSKLANSDN